MTLSCIPQGFLAKRLHQNTFLLKNWMKVRMTQTEMASNPNETYYDARQLPPQIALLNDFSTVNQN